MIFHPENRTTRMYETWLYAQPQATGVPQY